jgi:hypothetical protein
MRGMKPKTTKKRPGALGSDHAALTQWGSDPNYPFSS